MRKASGTYCLSKTGDEVTVDIKISVRLDLNSAVKLLKELRRLSRPSWLWGREERRLDLARLMADVVGRDPYGSEKMADSLDIIIHTQLDSGD